MWDENIESRLNDLDKNGCIKPVRSVEIKFADWKERAERAADKLEALGAKSLADWFRDV